MKADPASVGLSTQMLAEAAKEIKDKARNRKCFIAVKEVSVREAACMASCNFGAFVSLLHAAHAGMTIAPDSNLVQNRRVPCPDTAILVTTGGRDRGGERGCPSVTASAPRWGFEWWEFGDKSLERHPPADLS